MRRLILWNGTDAWRAECALVELAAEAVTVTGTQLGVEPVPYRADYELEAREGFVTRRLRVEAAGDDWRRRIELRREGEGTWTCHADAEGAVALSPAGGGVDGLADAIDCDLALSPLTNLMPIRRNSLHERAGDVEIAAAWVSVPDLGLHVSRQSYTHVRDGVVRYADASFSADLQLDEHGLVLTYPGLARRVEGSP